MRVIIATVQVPFIYGGAEILAEGLRRALLAAGHEVELASIPVMWDPPQRMLDHILICRMFDLSRTGGGTPVDRLIGLKFPAYLIPHPNKVLWLLHQHRQAYDMWDHTFGLIHAPNGGHVCRAIREADHRLIPESKAVFTISGNVTQRLRKYCAIESTPIYHPPQDAERFYTAAAEDYIFFPSRINMVKRQALVIEALKYTQQPVRVHFAGTADTPAYGEEMQALALRLKVDSRVQWLGAVTQQEKLDLFARSRAVLYPPLDEDYGYVTLEAMLASKPLITCTDSGGPLEFVRSDETGIVAQPTPQALAAAMDRIWQEPDMAKVWGDSARARYTTMGISWSNVVERLLA